jgi:hypothetical protein
LPKSKELVGTSYWTVEQSKCRSIHYQKYRRGKIIRLQENKKLLSDALLDENHIPDIEIKKI